MIALKSFSYIKESVYYVIELNLYMKRSLNSIIIIESIVLFSKVCNKIHSLLVKKCKLFNLDIIVVIYMIIVWYIVKLNMIGYKCMLS